MGGFSLTASPIWATTILLPSDWTGPAIPFKMRTPIARIRRDLDGEILPEHFQ